MEVRRLTSFGQALKLDAVTCFARSSARVLMNSKESTIDELKALQDVQLNPSTESQLELLVQAAETLEIEDPSLIAYVAVFFFGRSL